MKWNISVIRGKENKSDFLSNGEWTGKSADWKSDWKKNGKKNIVFFSSFFF